MQFTVIDTQTGEYPELSKIARTEDWAKNLVYCDVDGFAITEDGSLILMDDCGNCAYPPSGRFVVVYEEENHKDAQGIWELIHENDGKPTFSFWRCSACHKAHYLEPPTADFCRACGAKMIRTEK